MGTRTGVALEAGKALGFIVVTDQVGVCHTNTLTLSVHDPVYVTSHTKMPTWLARGCLFLTQYFRKNT